MGRYSKTEINLLKKCLGANIPTADIKLLLKDHKYYRTIESIEKKMQELDEERKALQRERVQKHANKDLAKYRANSLFYSARSRAKKKNIPFELTKEWVEEKVKAGVCERTGIKFVLSPLGTGRGKGDAKAPSLDKIDPNKGYTLENTRVVINNYNKFKGIDNDAEMIKIARAIVRNHDRKYSLQIAE